jgi:hypothetical protein
MPLLSTKASHLRMDLATEDNDSNNEIASATLAGTEGTDTEIGNL